MQWGGIVHLAVVCAVLGYLFYNYALTKLDAVQVATWVYLRPPIAAGGAAILASGWLVSRSRW